ncbi:hypothetical protein NYZ99_02610 [Maribacter litopenaei]|uniref:Uncharacterized protein n=1 Tax=Maribacter litopenaei TaxID=2976127 RepID=A0ABY5Y8T7_9FLAO|nr:hypothetical protein [Maribacter litopenaei]UWX55450.1 hypothetical protein NYZ99_02610 [Maribacter litopenaei]
MAILGFNVSKALLLLLGLFLLSIGGSNKLESILIESIFSWGVPFLFPLPFTKESQQEEREIASNKI